MAFIDVDIMALIFDGGFGECGRFCHVRIPGASRGVSRGRRAVIWRIRQSADGRHNLADPPVS